jgi:hypothetical protein
MNDILSELQQQSNQQVKLDSSHDFVSDGVWEATLYRLGYDERYYKDIEPCDREDFLNRLEKHND